jgi:hypothetical protein
MALDRAQQARWGRVGGLRTAARHDVRLITLPARQAFEARFYTGIPEDLPQAERDRRASAARRAYFAEMTARSVTARAAAKKKAGPDRDSGPANDVRQTDGERPAAA